MKLPIILALGIALLLGAPQANAQTQSTGCQSQNNVYGLPPVNGSIFQGAASQRVMFPATQLFWDDFGTGTLDTTNRWQTPVAAGGAVAATNAVAQTVLSSGTTANGYSYLLTQPNFSGRNPGWVFFQQNNNIESPVLPNAYRAWGFMSVPATPTIAAPLTNAAVFEINTDGHLRAVTYNSGTRNVIADLSNGGSGETAAASASTFAPATPSASIAQGFGSGTQPSDASAHRYAIYFRGDMIIWMIADGLCPDRMVAAIGSGSLGPDVNTLTAGDLAIAGSPGPSAAATIQVNSTTIADTTNANQQMSDGTFPWRKVQVGPSGDTLTSLHPITTTLLGSYSKSLVSGTMAAGLGANAPVFSFRYGGSNLAIVRRVYVSVVNQGTAFAAGAGNLNLIAARAFSASDSGGTAATLTGNNGKLRTSLATTGVSDIRISSTATLTAGTRTLDTDPLGAIEFPCSATASAVMVPPSVIYEPKTAEYPLVLANNEGFVMTANVAATGTWSFSVWVDWDEYGAF